MLLQAGLWREVDCRCNPTVPVAAPRRTLTQTNGRNPFHTHSLLFRSREVKDNRKFLAEPPAPRLPEHSFIRLWVLESLALYLRVNHCGQTGSALWSSARLRTPAKCSNPSSSNILPKVSLTPRLESYRSTDIGLNLSQAQQPPAKGENDYILNNMTC